MNYFLELLIQPKYIINITKFINCKSCTLAFIIFNGGTWASQQLFFQSLILPHIRYQYICAYNLILLYSSVDQITLNYRSISGLFTLNCNEWVNDMKRNNNTK